MNTKRVPTLLLCCLLLLSIFAGCGKQEEESGNLITYLPTFHRLEDQSNSVGAACSGTDTMYFIASIPCGVDS